MKKEKNLTCFDANSIGGEALKLIIDRIMAATGKAGCSNAEVVCVLAELQLIVDTKTVLDVLSRVNAANDDAESEENGPVTLPSQRSGLAL